MRPCGADDKWTNEWWGLGKRGLLESRDFKISGTNGIERRPVAIAAAGYDSIEAVEAVLPGCESGLFGPHVLQEQQVAAGLQHAPNFAEGPCLIDDTAEHECRHNGVETGRRRTVAPRPAPGPTQRGVTAPESGAPIVAPLVPPARRV